MRKVACYGLAYLIFACGLAWMTEETDSTIIDKAEIQPNKELKKDRSMLTLTTTYPKP